MRSNYFIAYIVAAIVMVFTLQTQASAQEVAQKDVVDFQLRWHHQFQFAGYYAAVEQGYYRDEGLEVRLHAGDPAHQPVQEVQIYKQDR